MPNIRQIHPVEPDDTCYTNARNRGQRTFTLVEQDRSAVHCIAYWILQNVHTAPADKLRDALEDCIVWREFAAVKDAD